MPLLTELVRFWIWNYKYVAPMALCKLWKHRKKQKLRRNVLHG